MFVAGQLVTIPPGSSTIPLGTTIDLMRLISTSRLLEAGGFGPLPDQRLLLRIADSQQGKIRPLPDMLNRNQQAAQMTRRIAEASKPLQAHRNRGRLRPSHRSQCLLRHHRHRRPIRARRFRDRLPGRGRGSKI